jgi:hypothetical protein
MRTKTIVKFTSPPAQTRLLEWIRTTPSIANKESEADSDGDSGMIDALATLAPVRRNPARNAPRQILQLSFSPWKTAKASGFPKKCPDWIKKFRADDKARWEG